MPLRYKGNIIQECQSRTSGHRSSFREEKSYRPALSMHARKSNIKAFSLDIFKEEFIFIEKYRTNHLGLSRYKL